MVHTAREVFGKMLVSKHKLNDRTGQQKRFQTTRNKRRFISSAVLTLVSSCARLATTSALVGCKYPLVRQHWSISFVFFFFHSHAFRSCQPHHPSCSKFPLHLSSTPPWYDNFLLHNTPLRFCGGSRWLQCSRSSCRLCPCTLECRVVPPAEHASTADVLIADARASVAVILRATLRAHQVGVHAAAGAGGRRGCD